MAKKKSVAKPSRPNRDPDHYSKRGVPYWWSPEWVRGTGGEIPWIVEKGNIPASDAILMSDGRFVRPCDSYGKIHAIKKGQDVQLHMLSKDGNLSFIRGSIQQEFRKWHEDRQIDYMLLGEDPDEIIKDLSLED